MIFFSSSFFFYETCNFRETFRGIHDDRLAIRDCTKFTIINKKKKKYNKRIAQLLIKSQIFFPHFLILQINFHRGKDSYQESRVEKFRFEIRIAHSRILRSQSFPQLVNDLFSRSAQVTHARVLVGGVRWVCEFRDRSRTGSGFGIRSVNTLRGSCSENRYGG